MTRPLRELSMEAQIRKLEEEIRRIEEGPIVMRNELLDSPYMDHTPVNSGPGYLEVRVRLWPTLEMMTDYGPVKRSEEARVLAKKNGFIGIRTVFGGE